MTIQASAGGATVAPPTTHVHPKGLTHRITLHDAPELATALANIMPDWPMTVDSNPHKISRSVSDLSRDGSGGYSFRSWWATDPVPHMGVAGAVCGAVADMVQAFCDDRPGTIGLHCGAVRIGGHLVAFTGPFRAGKTTLVTRLGFEPGMTLFCDDILPILPDDRACALGIQPRLRLPLPDSVSATFRQSVQDTMTLHDARYGYVAAPNLAPHGTRAPLAALIVLNRRPSGPASLHPLGINEAAQHFIRQNIADPGEIDSHFARIAGLAGAMPCLQLAYSDLEQAVALLRDTFDRADVSAIDRTAPPPVPIDPPQVPETLADLSDVFERACTVVEQDIGGDRFLWQVEARRFYGLNPVGRAVWVLLEQPLTGHALCEIVQDAFPEVSEEAVQTDLAVLLADMVQADLISARADA